MQTYPVSADYRGVGEWNTPGLSYDDYFRMDVIQQKLNAHRDLSCPDWAANDNELKTVLAWAMEARSGFWKKQQGTDEERIARAQRNIKASLPRRKEILDELCNEYVELKKVDPAADRLRELQIEIEGIDTFIRTSQDDGGLLLLTGCVQCFWRECLSSVDCAARLNIKPPHVRQIIFMLREAAESIGFEQQRRPKGRFGRRARRTFSAVRTLPIPTGPVPVVPNERYLKYVKFCDGMGITPPTEAQWRMNGNA